MSSEAASLTILCLSRAYLSRLFPAMAERHPGARYLHIVQTDRERAFIESRGGEVVLSMESAVRSALREGTAAWKEPGDFREVTGFPWSPILADRYLPSFAGPVRDRIAGALYRALEDVFDRYRIDAFLSEPVALFVTHCLFYLARKRGARRLLWANAWFPGWFYFADGIDISCPVRSAPMSSGDRAALSTDVSSYLDGVIEDRRGPAYHHSFLERKLSPLSFFKQRRGTEPLVIQPGLLSRMIQRGRLTRAWLTRAAFPRRGDFMTAGAVDEHRAYLHAQLTGNGGYDVPPVQFDERRVVYPLQYEPEASLLYFAPDFRHQPALVEAALRALPDGHTLWVKEHPNQCGALGAPIWRQLKKQHSALRFIRGRQSGRDLMRNAGLVLTVSSSAGMDALALGRRALVTGQVFYRHFAGALPVNSYSELAQALNVPENYRPLDNRASLTEQLVDFGTRCYPGDPQPRHDLFSPENLDLLVAAVASECAL
jgi:hypothetical protein